MRFISAELRNSIWSLSLFALILPGAHAFADAPPSWQPFTVCAESEQGKSTHCARVIREKEDGAKRPEQHRYKLQVVKKRADRDSLLWERSYHFDGYPGGLLTADGATFVSVSFWYFDDRSVVRIYRKGATHRIPGRAFQIPASQLRKTASHRLWLAEASLDLPSYRLVDTTTLELRTIDGRTHVINLTEGSCLSCKPR